MESFVQPTLFGNGRPQKSHPLPIKARVRKHREKLEKRNFKQVAVYLPGEVLAQLDAECEDAAESRSVLLTHILKEYYHRESA